MKLHKIDKSIRIPKDFQDRIGREIVRLSLNPVLYARSSSVVRWNRSANSGISPLDVIVLALERYPSLSLSSAVETVLVDLLQDHAASPPQLSPDELEQLRRFSRLPLVEKIRVTQKRHRTLRYLQSLRSRHETRKRI